MTKLNIVKCSLQGLFNTDKLLAHQKQTKFPTEKNKYISRIFYRIRLAETYNRRNSISCGRRLCLRLLWPWTCCDLDLSTQNLISTPMNYEPKYICDQNWINSLHWFLRYGVHKVFGTHRLTRSLTDGQTRIHDASSTAFFMYLLLSLYDDEYSCIYNKRLFRRWDTATWHFAIYLSCVSCV